MNQRRFRKTRIAPTPSGYLHLGNACSFLLTAGLARETGASLLLRIDDMDRERFRPEYLEDIFATLDFLDIHPGEGPRNSEDFQAHWSQRTRLPLYDSALNALAAAGAVFACTCSRTDLQRSSGEGYSGACRHKGLPLDTPGAAWRLRTGNPEPVTVHLLSSARESYPLSAAQTDFVVRKKDGSPAYQLSSLVDDVHFGTDLVVRGRDLWDSTLAQLYLARVLGYTSFGEAVFHHHPLLKNEAGEKLSKSAGAASLRQFREKGGSRSDLLALLQLPDQK